MKQKLNIFQYVLDNSIEFEISDPQYRNGYQFKNQELTFREGYIEFNPELIKPISRLEPSHKNIEELFLALYEGAPQNIKDSLKEYDKFYFTLLVAILEKDSNRITELEEIYTNFISQGKGFAELRAPIYKIGLDKPFNISYDRNHEIEFTFSSLQDIERAYMDNAGQLPFLSNKELPSLSIIIRGSFDENKQNLHQDIIHKLIIVLTLTGNGAAYSNSQEQWFSSGFGGWRAFRKSNTSYGSPRYVLTNNHKNFLEDNLTKILKGLNLCALYENKSITPTSVAYENYIESLNATNIFKRAAFAVMGLEAILTNKSSEISYSLQLKGTLLANILWGKNTDYHKNLLKKAYAIRSDYAHGNTNREKRLKGIEQRSFTFFLQELLRSLILTNVLEQGNLDFDALTDASLLKDFRSSQKLSSSLKRVGSLLSNLN